MEFLKDVQVNDKVCIKTSYSEEWATVLKVEDDTFEVSGYRMFNKYTGKPYNTMGYHSNIIGIKKADIKRKEYIDTVKLKVYQPSCVEMEIIVEKDSISKEVLELLEKGFAYGLDNRNNKIYWKIMNQLALLPKNVKPVDDIFTRFELIKD